MKIKRESRFAVSIGARTSISCPWISALLFSELVTCTRVYTTGSQKLGLWPGATLLLEPPEQTMG